MEMTRKQNNFQEVLLTGMLHHQNQLDTEGTAFQTLRGLYAFLGQNNGDLTAT